MPVQKEKEGNVSADQSGNKKERGIGKHIAAQSPDEFEINTPQERRAYARPSCGKTCMTMKQAINCRTGCLILFG